MKKTLTRVCVEVNNFPRQIFTLKEDKKGMLLITTKTGEYITDKGEIYVPRQFKTTVHPKDDSLEQIAIHTTIESRDNTEKRERFIYTSAAKDEGFVTAYIRRCVTLSKDRFEPSEVDAPETAIRIAGSHDPETMMLFYSIVIGPPNAEVPFLSYANLYTTVFRCSRFSLVVLLSSLAVLRPVNNGSYILPATFDPKHVPAEFKAEMEQLGRGVSFQECAYEFWTGCYVMAAEHVAAEFKSCPEDMPEIKNRLGKSFEDLKYLANQHMDLIRPQLLTFYFRNSFWKYPDPSS